MTEYWKDIEGYEGKYQISTLGRVKSLNYNHTNKEKILKPAKMKNGYLHVVLCKDNKTVHYTIHRLVAQAFIHNPNSQYYNEVNHIDENKENNNIENLEWCTRKYNVNYGTSIERASKSNTNNIKTSKPVIGINKISGYIVEYPSTHEAERSTGIHQSDICNCCNGKRKSAGGYRWYYVNKEVEK